MSVIAGENTEQRQMIEKLKAQLSESQQREKMMVRRLAAKEQETQDYMVSNLHDNSGSNVQKQKIKNKLCDYNQMMLMIMMMMTVISKSGQTICDVQR